MQRGGNGFGPELGNETLMGKSATRVCWDYRVLTAQSAVVAGI